MYRKTTKQTPASGTITEALTRREYSAKTQPPTLTDAPVIQSAPRFLDKEGAAKLLGVSVRCLEVWMRKRLVVFSRIGRTIRFSAEDLENHVRTKLRVV